MSKRNLQPEIIKSPYFKATDSTVSEEEGTRELGPLNPFVISGGKNTERFYIQHISALTEYRFEVRPRYFGDESSYTEVFPKRIKEILHNNAHAKIFCLIDFDDIVNDKSHDNIRQKRHDAFLKLFGNEIEDGSIVVCPSMPSIEYWFLLHFEDYRNLLKNLPQVISKLAPHMKSYFEESNHKFSKMLKKAEYLEDKGWVEQLIADGKMEAAIKRAENNIKLLEETGEFHKSSYTYLFKLFR